MRGHFHTGPVDILVTTLGVLVAIHVMRLLAVQMADRPGMAGASKVLATFALAD